MCIIAGYNGTERAAPLIIEMLRKTEGIDAGCYTGIATMHEGKIHYRKLAGNLDRLLAETDAMDLPGNIGIIHSRTPGGHNGDNWAHPFTYEKDGEVLAANILNGTGGCGNRSLVPKLIRELPGAGYPLKSAGVYDGKEKHLDQCDDDMNMYHVSDVVTQNICRYIFDGGLDAPDAMIKSYEELNGEHVCLMLSVTDPEAINWVRMNFPMFVGTTDHGTFMGTVPLGFAEHTQSYTLLPPLVAGKIYKDGFTVKKMPKPPFTVAPITPEVWDAAYKGIPELLAKGERNFGDSFAPYFAEAACVQRNAVSWAVLSDLYLKGKVEMVKETLPGVREGLLKTRFNYVWKG